MTLDSTWAREATGRERGCPGDRKWRQDREDQDARGRRKGSEQREPVGVWAEKDRKEVADLKGWEPH